MIEIDGIAKWLDGCPPGLIITFRHVRLRKSFTAWTCIEEIGSFAFHRVGKYFTSTQIAGWPDLFMVPAKQIPTGYEWKTKEGKILKIADMSDDHLVNTTKLLRRKLIGIVRDQHRALLMFANSDNMGEHAYDALQQELSNLPEHRSPPKDGEFEQALDLYEPDGQIQSLVTECSKRGLINQFGEKSFFTDLAGPWS